MHTKDYSMVGRVRFTRESQLVVTVLLSLQYRSKELVKVTDGFGKLDIRLAKCVEATKELLNALDMFTPPVLVSICDAAIPLQIVNLNITIKFRLCLQPVKVASCKVVTHSI